MAYMLLVAFDRGSSVLLSHNEGLKGLCGNVKIDDLARKGDLDSTQRPSLMVLLVE